MESRYIMASGGFEDWKQRNPRAYQELLSLSLQGEENLLRAELPRAERGRKEWIERRLEDFDWLNSNR